MSKTPIPDANQQQLILLLGKMQGTQEQMQQNMIEGFLRLERAQTEMQRANDERFRNIEARDLAQDKRITEVEDTKKRAIGFALGLVAAASFVQSSIGAGFHKIYELLKLGG